MHTTLQQSQIKYAALLCIIREVPTNLKWNELTTYQYVIYYMYTVMTKITSAVRILLDAVYDELSIYVSIIEERKIC